MGHGIWYVAIRLPAHCAESNRSDQTPIYTLKFYNLEPAGRRRPSEWRYVSDGSDTRCMPLGSARDILKSLGRPSTWADGRIVSSTSCHTCDYTRYRNSYLAWDVHRLRCKQRTRGQLRRLQWMNCSARTSSQVRICRWSWFH